ncbi:LysM domain-containing protein [Leifsonia sp. F6_8S_P_1B]|uniref:LysM domain-containing protein n=1 Tax=Leifsonia williamsii TaxID=3035919 RepID=A0ABT8K7Q7_9MICO|nr:LysM domain-containing protein [Leifsonia williamsii]MDN4613033.1 LysM domain-containing protein [Leifsonia williamsii]
MNRRNSPRRAAAAVGMLAALTIALSGCALFAGAEPRAVSHTRHATPKPTRTPAAPTPNATPTPTPTPTAPPAPPPTLASLPAGTTVAEADVASPKGSIHFHYRVVADGDNTYSIEYSGFTSTVPVPISVTLIDVPPRVGDGITWHGVGDHPLGGPTTSAAPSSSVPLDNVGNPSDLGTLLTYSSAPSADGVPVELGPGKILAVDRVRWSIPTRDTNVHPADSGPRPGANGRVSETTDSGAPATYVVGTDDTFDAVAGRFGISAQALLWLNPGERSFDGGLNLFEGTSVNLDPQVL